MSELDVANAAIERVLALATEWATESKHRNIGPQFAARLFAALESEGGDE